MYIYCELSQCVQNSRKTCRSINEMQANGEKYEETGSKPE